MKHGVALTLSAMMAAASLSGADNLETMFSDGAVKGEVRLFYINRDDNTKAEKQISTAIGGKLLYETASLNGMAMGTGFYTTNRIFRSLEKDAVGPNTTLLKNDGSSYAILGEAYLKYDMSGLGTKSDLKLGRQRLDTPLAGSDDARMLPNLFEAYVLHNNDIDNTTLALAHVTQFAPGSFANAYNGGIVGATAGYTAVAGNTAALQGRFINMGEWAVGEKTDGVTAVAAIYSSENMRLQAWDYYAHDILNALYLQGDFKWDCKISSTLKPFAAIQMIKENDVGEQLVKNIGGNGEIDSLYWAAKAGASYGALKAYVAYSQQSENGDGDAAYKNATITAWGGMPAFTQGMVTRHQFLAGTEATKVAATYSFKEQGVNLTATGYYALFDMDKNSGYGTERTTYEPGFDMIYYPEAVKNLQLRLRGNFPNEFGNGRSWDEYRFIANYNF